MKRFSIQSVVCVIVMFAVSITCVYGAEEENIALTAKVETSSNYTDTYVGENAVDGVNDQEAAETRWLSGKSGDPGKGSDPPHWLTMDFGKSMKIDRVDLYFYTNWAPVEYVIQYDNNGKWVDIKETQVENGARGDITKSFEIDTTVGTRILRFYCTDGSSYDAQWGNIVRLSEIEVYSSGPMLTVVRQGKLTTTWGKMKK